MTAAPIGLSLLLALSAPVGLSAKSKSTQAKRLGNNTEGATLVSHGHGEAKIALLDGYDVLVVNVGGKSKAPAHKAFDVKAHPWAAFPSGIAYLGVEKNYVFGDQGSFDALVVTNSGGHLLPTRPIQYLPGTPAVIATEGLLYLDENSAFPDTIGRAVWFEDFTPSIEIMTRQGVVLQEIPVGPPVDYITGLTYLSSGAFLVSNASPNIWTVALDGTVTGGPAVVAEAGDIEGLVALADGRVYAGDYTAGRLFGFDADLVRQASLDRSYAVGLGLSRTIDAVWDPTTGGFIMNGLGREHAQFETSAVSEGLDSKQVLFQHPDTFGLAILGDGSLATCQVFGPARVLHHSRTGALLDELNLTTIPGLPPARCRAVAYLSSIDAYAIVLRGGGARPVTVYLVSRAGVLLGSFVTPAPIQVLSVPPDGAGDQLLVWGLPDLFTYDASGTLLSTRTPNTGRLFAPVGFAAMPGGGYALFDPNNSEAAIFQP
jgi:hypothetical protein